LDSCSWGSNLIITPVFEVHHEWDVGDCQGCKIVSMKKIMVVPFIEVGDCKNRDIHAFEIVNTK